MLSRERAVLALKQIWKEQKPVPDKHKRDYHGSPGAKSACHYGICEFRSLMDAIYEGPPQTPEQEVTDRPLF